MIKGSGSNLTGVSVKGHMGHGQAKACDIGQGSVAPFHRMTLSFVKLFKWVTSALRCVPFKMCRSRQVQ